MRRSRAARPTRSIPAPARSLGKVADAGAADVDAAVAAAKAAFKEWRNVLPLERAKMLRRIAEVLRKHAQELAMIDAADCGNPVAEMVSDAMVAAAQTEFFAGLVTEMKGASVPMGPGVVNFSVREPRGVVGAHHPVQSPVHVLHGQVGRAARGRQHRGGEAAGAVAALLAAARRADRRHPAARRVQRACPAARKCGAALAGHQDVAMVALVGSVPTGRAVMRAAADTVKPVMLELGGKNALIAYPDADPDEVAGGVIGGMNFTWCGQSCGSTSRAFIHEKIYDAVLARVKERIKHFKPGIPTDPDDHHGGDRLEGAVRPRDELHRRRPSRKARGCSPAADRRTIRRSPRASSSSRPCSPT